MRPSSRNPVVSTVEMMSESKTYSDVPSVTNAEIFESTLDRSAPSSSERRRSFAHILASPIHYEPGYPYPLLVWLHDIGKYETELFDVVPKISARNYVAVAPRGVSCTTRRVVRNHIGGRLVNVKNWLESCNDWPDTEDAVLETENLVFDSIEQAKIKFNVNSRRVFLIGRGVGATMAVRVGLRNPHEFAGVVSIDGAFPDADNMLLRNWRSARSLPILMTTGANPRNGFSSFTRSQLNFMHAAGLTVFIRQYDEVSCHPAASQARMDKILLDVNRWIMKRALNPQTPVSEMFS